jgi:hypothetical protein
MNLKQNAVELIKNFVQEQTGLTFPHWVANYRNKFTPNIVHITLEELTKTAMYSDSYVFASTDKNVLGKDIETINSINDSAFFIMEGDYYIYTPVLEVKESTSLKDAALKNIADKVKEIVGVADLVVHNTNLVDISCANTKYTLETAHNFLKVTKGRLLLATNDPDLIPTLGDGSYFDASSTSTAYTYVVCELKNNGYTYLHYFVGTN